MTTAPLPTAIQTAGLGIETPVTPPSSRSAAAAFHRSRTTIPAPPSRAPLTSVHYNEELCIETRISVLKTRNFVLKTKNFVLKTKKFVLNAKNFVDCELTGRCDAGTCHCFPGWQGPTCATLDLLPAPRRGAWPAERPMPPDYWGDGATPISCEPLAAVYRASAPLG